MLVALLERREFKSSSASRDRVACTVLAIALQYSFFFLSRLDASSKHGSEGFVPALQNQLYTSKA